jgi:histidine triad (HIT) family protein
VAGDGGDDPSGDDGRETAPDGLDFGELGHAGSIIAGRTDWRPNGGAKMGDSEQVDRHDAAFDPDCVFCRIIRGDFGTGFVAETDRAVAFADISPQAPVHVLVVPRRHVASLAATTAVDADLLGELVGLARDVAEASGLAESGYRVLTNVGPDAGQTVFHLHVHVLGGRDLGTGLTSA